MRELLLALALLLVIEGLLLAIAPGLPPRLLEGLARTPREVLRVGGLVAAALGVFFVWLLRG